MGKRKSSKPPPKKVQLKVPKVFDCPFCNGTSSIECKMNRKENTGKIHCRTCGTTYEAKINYLTDPIDVYAEWIDECRKINEVPENQRRVVAPRSRNEREEESSDEEALIAPKKKKVEPIKKKKLEPTEDDDPETFLRSQGIRTQDSEDDE